MKRILIALVLSLAICLFLSACGGCDYSSLFSDDIPKVTSSPELEQMRCNHSFGEYSIAPNAECGKYYLSYAICSKCGVATYGEEMKGSHKFDEAGLCVYCGRINMKSGVEYRDGDFIFLRRGDDRCEAKLAEDAVVENVIFPSEYGGYEVVMISMANSEAARRAVKHISIPAGVKSTSVYAFKNCAFLESVSIEYGCQLGAIGYEAFAGCVSLKSVELENCESLTEIGARAFASCSSLEQVTLPRSVSKIEERAFTGCSSLEKVSLESEYVSLGVGVFLDCISLSNVNFLNKVETIPGSAFSGCIGLGRIRIPDSVKYIEDYAFEKSGVIEVALPHSLLSLGNMAFFECLSLQRVEIYDGIKKINTSTFAGCRSLDEVILPSTLEEIYASAFSDCAALQRIVIPASVSSIAANAFYLDHALSEVIFERTSGWKRGNEAVEETTLADPVLAAELLKEGYLGENFVQRPLDNVNLSN